MNNLTKKKKDKNKLKQVPLDQWQ